jgi:hypothetical protein
MDVKVGSAGTTADAHLPVLPQHSLVSILNGSLAYMSKFKANDTPLPGDARQALVDRLRALLDRSLKAGVPVDVTSFNALLHVYAQSQMLARASPPGWWCPYPLCCDCRSCSFDC